MELFYREGRLYSDAMLLRIKPIFNEKAFPQIVVSGCPMSELCAGERKRRESIIIKEYGGILPMYEAFYLEAVAYAAGCAVEAFERYDAAVENGQSRAAIVANVHEALTHAAGVSRFFWPPRGKSAVASHRAEKLRQMFGIADDSPLYARDLRNTLEHFDERLDEYLLDDLAGYVFPGPMVGSANMTDEQIGHLFRLVDPEEEVFVLFGKKYSFGPLREAVAMVYHLARGSADTGG